MAKTGQTLIDELRADLDSKVDGTWVDTDLLMWLNKGLVELMSRTRAQREHWYDRVVLSTDSAFTRFGTTYTPSTDLKPTAGATTITLPPDCIEVVKILPIDQDDLDQGLQFIQRKQTSIEFVQAQRCAENASTRTYYFDSYGLTTLKVAPVFGASFDISLQYVAVPEEITLTDTITRTPDWMLDAAVLYAHFRALQAIKHDDFASAFQIFEQKCASLLQLTRPRESQDPQIVEGVWDCDDVSWAWDNDM